MASKNPHGGKVIEEWPIQSFDTNPNNLNFMFKVQL